MKRIVPLILILALLIATVAAETNDQATDFEQRNIELPVTATDAVTNTDVMPPQDESMAAADTAQKTDIVCVLKITTANIYTIQSLTLQFGSSACYHSCSPCASFSYPERVLFENLTMVNNQYQAGVTYTGGIIPKNQHLLEYRFSTTYAYDFAVSLITNPVGVAIKYGDMTNEYTDFAEKIVVMAGDVNADQSVNAADTLLVMQYISGKASLTESQKIAADVNRDGQINAADTLQMQKYAVAKISSFWDYKTLSNTENENIDTTQIYRFRNMDTNKHLSINSITSKGAWGEYPREEASCKFKFTYLGRGLYQISLANNANTVLCMDADRRLSFMNINSAQRYKWYVEGSGQYFRLMNFSSKDQMISYHKSGEPGVGYNTYGMYWEIHTKEPQVLLDTYFDYGYAIRYSNGNTTTAANEISDLTTFINRKLFLQFGITLKETSRETSKKRIASYGDQCLGTSNITFSNVTNMCSHISSCDMKGLCDHALDKQPSSYCSASCYDRYHHNCPDKIFSYFTEKQANGSGYISALFSGYNKCADTQGGGSMASFTSHDCLMMNFSPWYWDSQTIEQDKQYSYLHEIGHCLGARGDNSCPSQQCVMSYNYDPDALSQIFNSDINAFCTKCQNEIKETLNTLF